MAEVFIIANSSPGQHPAFKKWVNSRKYPFEGARKGFNRPFITETKLWSVKIKRECLPMFLAELKASTQEMSGHGGGNVVWMAGKLQSIINFFIRCVNFWFKFRHRFKNHRPEGDRFPMKNELIKDKISMIDMKKIEPGQDTFPGWYNTKVLFATSDMVNNKGEEEL